MRPIESPDYKARIREFHHKGVPWSEVEEIPPRKYQMSRKVLKKMLGHVLPADRRSRILDVGCGPGFFMDFLQKEGYDNAIGIEINTKQVELAAKAGVKNVQQADLFDYLPQHRQEFDMVVASHIIEHLTKPEVLCFLDLIHGGLKTGGKVLIRVPNVASIYGSSSAFDFYHETGFTPYSIKQVMSVCHFTDIIVKGEEPIIRGLKSLVRAVLWKCLKTARSLAKSIEIGSREARLGIPQGIYENNMYAAGIKAE